MPCQGCAERREWIKKWINVGADRAKALLGGGVIAVAAVDIIEPIVESIVEEVIIGEEDGRTDTSVNESDAIIEPIKRRDRSSERSVESTNESND